MIRLEMCWSCIELIRKKIFDISGLVVNYGISNTILLEIP